ncbi:SCP2 domain-containing protein [Yersinia mollaretii]|uniref:Ubiquinone biosynthesis accessory factor UbiJ n=1 Tax=Yersinia mollaretii TaxID=33060 RepID=A0AA44I0F6_YERMO|nr:SCP2 domain-containing protein [Yersinia mollaretii]CNK81591.1 protein YigP (COG3165) clustered with ubiquinone biosynthetic genes [Yersinia enterocolitica]NIL23352.1 SCP2 domain-containing protein [Yersinia mollaretii]CNJ15444.1 protein YigP (COG3165) clustered with ubiquinone biosynthetic genes [Yersinia mollaretii]CNK66304.1 protein YigP (COG3165) clustered with ubiquinone biosynthetic genes [Yersinia mollaretii]CQQ91513.1 protein YigP (COG3165) clustered with ubiquinone biosynthetic gen
MPLRSLIFKPFSLKPTRLSPLITATIETSLNSVLFRDKSMKAARLRLVGKVLRIELREMSFPLLLIFSERQVDVLSQWDGDADCIVKTEVAVLAKLRDRQQLSPLMRSGELIVEGDIQVVQQLVALLDLAEWDPAEWLAPYVGDIAAETIGQIVHKSHHFIREQLRQQQHYLAEAITEEWKMAPAPLEVVWFNEEVDATARATEALSARLATMETKQ